MIEDLLGELKDIKIDIRMGGQIGISLQPVGWNKSFIMQFINKHLYKSIHF